MADLDDPNGSTEAANPSHAGDFSDPPADVGGVTVYASKLKPEHETGLFHPHLDQIISELGSGARGFGDTATLGLLPFGIAGFNALLGRGSFRDNLSHEQSVDQADAAAHPIAHNIGEALGVLLPLAVGGVGPILAGARGLGMLRAAAPAIEATAEVSNAAKIAAASKGVGHVFRTGAATGAASGVAGQATSDLISGHLSDAGDYIGAGLGGTAGGVAHPVVGAGFGGMVTGGSTPVFQALMHGRAPNAHDVYSGALIGFNGGRLAGNTAAAYADSLSSLAKGNLGESLSRFDTRLRGRTPAAKIRLPLSDYNGKSGYTVVDVPSYADGVAEYVESKFGKSRPRKRQRQAILEGTGLKVQHWYPSDVGGMAGVGMAGLLDADDTANDQ